nr:hypothetical protein [Tanacetum cinerariifolium]
MFTQEEQYTELLEPIPEPQQVSQNDNDVISDVTDVEQDRETVEQHSANFEETRVLYESLYHNLAVEVEKVNSVNLEQGKSQNPLNDPLDHACKYTKRIRELIILIRQTSPSINNSSDKLVAVTPKNKDKRVRFIEPVTSSRNTNIKTASSSNLVSNKPMLSSTGVKPFTSASGSQPSGNTKKNKIQRPPSSTQKNNVEAHLRTVKCSLKKELYC